MTDPHQPATPTGTDPADVEARSALAEALGKEVWPADRDTLMGKAQESAAPDSILSALGRLPAHRAFADVQEVAEDLGLGTEQQRS